MADTPITVRRGFGRAIHYFQHYSNGAITAGTNKQEWIMGFHGRIVDVICDSGAAGSGSDGDVIDVNINGTTIYTTQGNRPTLDSGDTGMFAEAGEPEVTTFVPGDVLSYDVDAVASGGGSSRFKIVIIVAER